MKNAKQSKASKKNETQRVRRHAVKTVRSQIKRTDASSKNIRRNFGDVLRELSKE